ncbi:MAG: diaminopimelate epimerase [Acidobacteriaceae bacterium]|nr:diaminopimelate epimerase [Acidobacteriaceae bacterium]
MIEFSKAHACGNDFLIVEAQHVGGRDLAGLTRAMCARTTGIGADGVEYLTLSNDREGTIRLYNADGSIAEISGNGTRCVAAWMAYRSGLRGPLRVGEEFRLNTDAGPRVCRLEEMNGAEFQFTTAMGVPEVRRATVCLRDGEEIGATKIRGTEIKGAVVSTGNPHFVISVADGSFTVAGRPWQEIGAAICTHPDFPKQTNVEFVHRVADDHIAIRIYERGVGPTSSSGTGTSATAAAMIALEGMPETLRVLAPGGEQVVTWPGNDAELQLIGPAVVVTTGTWLPEIQS